MEIRDNTRKTISNLAIFLALGAFFAALPLLVFGSARQDAPQASLMEPQTECTFSDGSTVTFGRKVSGAITGEDVWRAGDYEATEFAVSETMWLPRDLYIPAGKYTLFVDPSQRIPWTLIISKKIGDSGMSYPGEQYDLGRTLMGSDLVTTPAQNFSIGCKQNKSAPMFLWMETGHQRAYAKIMALKIVDGKATPAWN
jgi:Protein of unknown function (DUF2911)